MLCEIENAEKFTFWLHWPLRIVQLACIEEFLIDVMTPKFSNKCINSTQNLVTNVSIPFDFEMMPLDIRN